MHYAQKLSQDFGKRAGSTFYPDPVSLYSGLFSRGIAAYFGNEMFTRLAK